MEFKNFCGYEILNKKPLITYIECDYVGATEWGKNYGYVYRYENETMFVFSADRPKRLKEVYKQCCLKNELKPKQYKTIRIK